jgi:hypothetical protein
MSTQRKAARRDGISPKYHDEHIVARESTLIYDRESKNKHEKKRDEKTWVENTHRTASCRTRRNGLKTRNLAVALSQSRYSVYDVLVDVDPAKRHARASGGPSRPLRGSRDLMIPAHVAGNDEES